MEVPPEIPVTSGNRGRKEKVLERKGSAPRENEREGRFVGELPPPGSSRSLVPPVSRHEVRRLSSQNIRALEAEGRFATDAIEGLEATGGVTGGGNISVESEEETG